MGGGFHPPNDDPRARSIVWLRRDLRLDDNVAVAAAARESRAVCVAFAVDPALLANGRIGAPIVRTFFSALQPLRDDLQRLGSDLVLLQGDPRDEIPQLARRIGASSVHFNDDDEPDAIRRDAGVESALRANGVLVGRHSDRAYLGAFEVLNEAGAPYKVFTPYYRKWLDYHRLSPRLPVPSARMLRGRLLERAAFDPGRGVPQPAEFGFEASTAYPQSSEAIARATLRAFVRAGGPIERYRRDREFPALHATSALSPHLRAGTIGIRACAAAAREESWLRQLAWRDFYYAILRHFPHVTQEAFLSAGTRVRWSGNERAFQAWCEGRTGYPIVDAAMRQLNTTGWMHNRLRMITASFLTKDLLIDWRWGERYFERRLADADVAQNNGGWQWAASTGTDAVPYFRIFNPVKQGKRFDAGGAFIRSMIPELAGVATPHVHEPWLATVPGYPSPIVEHAVARARALAAYEEAFCGPKDSS